MGRDGIYVNKVTKAYKNQVILDDIELELECGKIYGMVGRNGCGKSIFLKLLAGLIAPSEGKIYFDGVELKKGKYADNTGIVMDCIGFLPEYSARENLQMIANIQKKVGIEEIDEILREVGLDPDSPKEYRKFSLGMKQKLSIAQAIMESPKYLFFDEPMNALDEQSVQKTRTFLREYVNSKNALMVITSHNREDIEILCDEVYEIKNGKINKMS